MNKNYQKIKQDFEKLGSWQLKYRELMLLGKNLPSLSDALKTNDAKVAGCESNVWLYTGFAEDETTVLCTADSDTRIVKGLLYIILTMVNGLTPDEIAKLDIADEFESLGLAKQLSESRGNGIRAIASAITQFAKAH